ncbi:hypothetical protein KSX_11970 [Ktedonospora formicarum]|uniref:Uncharacterized protein n=1 Tax=Ktedonospora formicarum TaxID=2778364 RepID=A0A8J3HSS4_9CHLR|nr:hypothetical protein KSX_11970 [Ktedonospora formicarum]
MLLPYSTRAAFEVWLKQFLEGHGRREEREWQENKAKTCDKIGYASLSIFNEWWRITRGMPCLM